MKQSNRKESVINGKNVFSPQNVREKFKRRVEALADLYKKQK